MPVTRVSDPVFTIERNPYYIGVDTAGNQLPYIDEVRFTYFADQQALNLRPSPATSTCRRGTS